MIFGIAAWVCCPNIVRWVNGWNPIFALMYEVIHSAPDLLCRRLRERERENISATWSRRSRVVEWATYKTLSSHSPTPYTHLSVWRTAKPEHLTGRKSTGRPVPSRLPELFISARRRPTWPSTATTDRTDGPWTTSGRPHSGSAAAICALFIMMLVTHLRRRR